jgi:hypothetical protein
MKFCAHCGLPPTRDCADHAQTVQRHRAHSVVKAVRLDQQSIHPRVRNGRTVHPKVDTKK